MKKFAALTLAVFFALDAFGAQVVRLVREPGTIVFSLQKGFGVQRDGKHEIVFTSVSSGKIIKRINAFKGHIASEDKKYFSRLDAIEIPQNAGKLKATGRIFYCSFEQKYCSVQKINEEL